MNINLRSFLFIVGVLVHEKVLNHLKFKCTKNALSINQNENLGELIQSTILVPFQLKSLVPKSAKRVNNIVPKLARGVKSVVPFNAYSLTLLI